jgi:hypothetical protein
VTCPALAAGYIVNLLSDNTSAIAWIRVAGKAQDPGTRRLARLASGLLVQACSLTTLFQTNHIPGKLNDEADCLSRLVRGSVPSWDYATNLCSRLLTCRICLLPPELLSTLAEILSSPLTGATYEEITTQLLLLLEVDILPAGSMPPALQSPLSALDPVVFPSILSGYLTAVAAGDNLQQLPSLTAKTLNGYLSTAGATITFVTNQPCSYHDPLPTSVPKRTL